MSGWAVEIAAKETRNDREAAGLLSESAELGARGLESARVSRIYWLEAPDAALSDLETLAERLLADAVIDRFAVNADALRFPPGAKGWIAEIQPLPGVSDPTAETVLKAAADMGSTPLQAARTGRKAYLLGELDEAEARRIVERLLMNAVIQTYRLRPLRAAKPDNESGERA